MAKAEGKPRRWLKGCALGLLVVGGLGAYLALWPVGISPVSWVAPPAPELSGPFAPNSYLLGAEVILLPGARGPEDVALDSKQRIYVGVDDGRILRMSPDGTQPETFADTGGRPLGLAFDAAGNLLVADAVAGLLSVDREGKVTVLSTEAGGRPYGLVDDVDVAFDGTVYFSDASWRWGLGHYVEDLAEHRPYGRLLSYEPEDGSVKVLLEDLYFANGVAVSHDESYVLVAETGTYQITRLWLKGPKAGQHDLFAENLPGFPDGVARDWRGNFWVALAAPRSPQLDAASPHPWLREVLLRLPRAMMPGPARFGFVLCLSPEGEVLHNLQDPRGDSYSPITSVQPERGQLYLGSLSYPGIARIATPDE
jgi:sugar lactone lactonase YvrE